MRPSAVSPTTISYGSLFLGGGIKMSNNILIHLSKTDFSGGEVVSGDLELQIDTAIPVRGVRLLLHGYEQSYWSRGAARMRSSGSGGSRATNSETLDWIKEEITLFGDPPLDVAALISDSFTGLFASGHYHTLEPGTHRYPFSFKLPELLPGDYEGSSNRSKIRYYLKGYLDIPLKIDIETTVPLTIHEVHSGSAGKQVSAVNEKTLFDSGAFVKMQATLGKDVLLPGESVDCQISIENGSGKPVQAVVVSLQRVETLRVKGASTVNIEEVTATKYEQSAATGEAAELNLSFAIPDNLYPTIVSGDLVQVEYRILVALEIPWASGLEIPWAMDFDVEVPVVLLEEVGQPGGVNA